MENKEEKPRVKKGLWKPEEDLILKTYVETHGEGNWTAVSAKSGLKRGGKSCRLRWKNYLRPNIKRGGMSQEEEDLIIRMHKLIGNRWSLIAGRLPGRTDNEVKNYWNTHLNKRCCDRKRKTMDSSNEEHSSDDKNKTKNKRSRQPCTSPTVCGTNPQETNTQELEEKRQEKAERAEERTITCTWTQDDAQGMNYYIQPPPTVDTNNNATFVFDDDPFMAYLDPFVLFESFGYTGGETHSLLGMMQ